MRIIHFSDIHIGTITRDPTALLDKRLLGMFNYYLRRHRHMHREYVERAVDRILAMSPDLVVCSGDVTCIGSPEEFAEARKLLAPLVRSTAFQFVYIPGNHDHYVPRKRCLKELSDTFTYLNGGRYTLQDLPLKIERPGVQIFVLQECQPTSPLSSAGRLDTQAGQKMADWLAQERNANEKRVVVGHYPLRRADDTPLSWRRRLYGAEPLEEALAAKQIDIMLCGHIHQPFLRPLSNDAMEICAGSLTTAGKFNVLDYSPATGTFRQFWEDVTGDIIPPARLSQSVLPEPQTPGLNPVGVGRICQTSATCHKR